MQPLLKLSATAAAALLLTGCASNMMVKSEQPGVVAPRLMKRLLFLCGSLLLPAR